MKNLIDPKHSGWIPMNGAGQVEPCDTSAAKARVVRSDSDGVHVLRFEK